MRPLSQTLTELIGFTEEVVTKPARYHGIPGVTGLLDLAREIRDADRRPAEGFRTTASGLAIVACLEAFFAGAMDPGSRWLSAIGALLPILRTEAWQALRNERDAAGQGGGRHG